jgi:hypothetical protein
VSAPPVPPAPVAWPASVHLPAAAAAAEDAELERAMLGLGLGSSEAPPPPHGPPADGWADPATALRIAAQAAAHRLLPALEQPPLTTAPSDAASWAARGHNIPPDERPAGQHAEAPLAMWSTPSEQGSPPPVRTPDPTPAEAAAARAATDSLPFPPAAGATARKKAAALALPGLRNEAGDFNCFLNVVLQCLWRCADFRRQVGKREEACHSDAIHHASLSGVGFICCRELSALHLAPTPSPNLAIPTQSHHPSWSAGAVVAPYCVSSRPCLAELSDTVPGADACRQRHILRQLGAAPARRD